MKRILRGELLMGVAEFVLEHALVVGLDERFDKLLQFVRLGDIG